MGTSPSAFALKSLRKPATCAQNPYRPGPLCVKTPTQPAPLRPKSHAPCFSRGSSVSRNPSPMKFTPSTVTVMNKPGKNNVHTAS